MKVRTHFLLLSGILLLGSCSSTPDPAAAAPATPEVPAETIPTPIGIMQFPEGEVQHVVKANDIQWTPCPAHLPPGCAITVLEGSPKAPDMFTARFQLDAGFYMAPHTHPKDERVTIISGQVAVAFGADATHEDATVFGPGDYYVNKRGEIHQVWVDSSSVLQITGIGPWKADFIES